ncbi:MAG: pyroglutamyl-peptidase I [Candidatus Obscuribacterales bacterium]|nr:pyroglutamyl-peptidase I [Candidatus Obscuribacterales bacterium]
MTSKKSTPHFVVAGFDPFGDASFNPSEEIAKLFPDLITVKSYGQVPVTQLVLPTCCRASWTKLKRTLDSLSDDDVNLVAIGLSAMSTHLELERVALNLRDYRIEDNNGHQPLNKRIQKKGENALFTTVPLDKVQKTLTDRGIPTRISNHAGTFVCNDVYFNALHYQKLHEHIKSALFVHVPLPKNFIAQMRGSKKMPKLSTLKTKRLPVKPDEQLKVMQEAMQIVILECLKHSG